jgi:hypothetical protein
MYHLLEEFFHDDAHVKPLHIPLFKRGAQVSSSHTKTHYVWPMQIKEEQLSTGDLPLDAQTEHDRYDRQGTFTGQTHVPTEVNKNRFDFLFLADRPT